MQSWNTVFGECRSYSNNKRDHQHEFAQLIFPLQGTLIIQTTHRHFAVGCSHLSFLPPNCHHVFYAESRTKLLVLDVPQPLLPTAVVQATTGGLSSPINDQWRSLRALMQSEVSRQPTTNSALTHLFFYAHNLLLRNNQPRSIQYIHDHYAEPLTLPQLAQLQGYTPTYYSEWFKQQTGLTLQLYLQKTRLAQAKTLLTQTDLPLLHIAQQVGYKHQATLTRLFKQHENVTPLAFRRQNKP